MQQLLSDREAHLIAELRRAHDDGLRLLNDRSEKASGLLERSKRANLVSDREKVSFLR